MCLRNLPVSFREGKFLVAGAIVLYTITLSTIFFFFNRSLPLSPLSCTLRLKHGDPETEPKGGFMLFLDLFSVTCFENSTLKKLVWGHLLWSVRSDMPFSFEIWKTFHYPKYVVRSSAEDAYFGVFFWNTVSDEEFLLSVFLEGEHVEICRELNR